MLGTPPTPKNLWFCQKSMSVSQTQVGFWRAALTQTSCGAVITIPCVVRLLVGGFESILHGVCLLSLSSLFVYLSYLCVAFFLSLSLSLSLSFFLSFFFFSLSLSLPV